MGNGSTEPNPSGAYADDGYVSSLVAEERFVQVFPGLVRALGSMHLAGIVQQVMYRFGQSFIDRLPIYEGHRWAPVTRAQLADELGLSEPQVHRAARELEAMGVLVTCQPEGVKSRRKWYRIDHRELDARKMQVTNPSHPEVTPARDPEVTDSSLPSLQEEEEVLQEELRGDLTIARDRPSKPSSPKTEVSRADDQDAKAVANALTRAWWEAQHPRPSMPFIAARKIVATVLERFDPPTVEAALARAGPNLTRFRLDEACRGRGQSTRADAETDHTRQQMLRVARGEL